ncbi:hypothetical protein BC828DRAFT_418176 [Blastocladiella britannica]|nr:hypothetical protein BC828DRAFT_418176 [Blastocladiella britannica]
MRRNSLVAPNRRRRPSRWPRRSGIWSRTCLIRVSATAASSILCAGLVTVQTTIPGSQQRTFSTMSRPSTSAGATPTNQSHGGRRRTRRGGSSVTICDTSVVVVKSGIPLRIIHLLFLLYY